MFDERALITWGISVGLGLFLSIVFIIREHVRDARNKPLSPLCKELLDALEKTPVSMLEASRGGTFRYLKQKGRTPLFLDIFWDEDFWFNCPAGTKIKVHDNDLWPELTKQEKKLVLSAARKKWYDVSSHQLALAQEALVSHNKQMSRGFVLPLLSEEEVHRLQSKPGKM